MGHALRGREGPERAEAHAGGSRRQSKSVRTSQLPSNVAGLRILPWICFHPFSRRTYLGFFFLFPVLTVSHRCQIPLGGLPSQTRAKNKQGREVEGRKM